MFELLQGAIVSFVVLLAVFLAANWLLTRIARSGHTYRTRRVFRAGFDARLRGVPRANNPYDPWEHPFRYYLWQDGWLSAVDAQTKDLAKQEDEPVKD